MRAAISDATALDLLRELDALVTNTFGLFGKKAVNEIKFFTKTQQIRAALKPQ